MNKKIIIESMINVCSYEKNHEKSLTREWIKYRIGIFMSFTLKSVKAQTNQKFSMFIKYADESEDIVKDIAKGYGELPRNVEFVKKSDYEERIKAEAEGSEKLYLVRMDSDDMYHRTYIQLLHEYEPKAETKMILNQDGYMYDSVNKKLAYFKYVAPPFYTQIYDTESYLNGERHWLPIGHLWIVEQPHEVMEKGKFIQHVHSNNTLSRFAEKHEVNIINDQDEVERILNEFIGE